jgi:2-C-methyl-D-erythritol 4-phosphate cytidylyltransferase
MESAIPKQFLKIGELPILVRTLKKFLSAGSVAKVVLAMNPQWMDYCRNMLAEYGIDTSRLVIISGGETRFLSMVNIVEACIRDRGAELTEDDLLCIHDCARPFVTEKIIADNFAAIGEFDMVTTSVPTIDTVLISQDGKSCTNVPDRSTIFCDQGPQTFRLMQFRSLQKQLSDEENMSFIEAGRMYRKFGLREGIVPGDRMNFKITTAFDLVLAEALIREGKI